MRRFVLIRNYTYTCTNQHQNNSIHIRFFDY